MEYADQALALVLTGLREHGRGLLGLRERLSLYGGQLEAGPQPSGGWQVRAVMPTGVAA